MSIITHPQTGKPSPEPKRPNLQECPHCHRSFENRTHDRKCPKCGKPIPSIISWIYGGIPMNDEQLPYVKPEIIIELDLETQAGSPGICGTPPFPLPESELGKCK